MKILRSFGHAAKGIETCYKTERNFKIHIGMAALAVLLGFLFNISLLQWVAILLCVVVVLALEMINTVVEKLCNFIHPGYHPAIKIIKDLAAGAVLLAAFISLITGCIIFLPAFFSFLQSI